MVGADLSDLEDDLEQKMALFAVFKVYPYFMKRLIKRYDRISKLVIPFVVLYTIR